MSRVWGKFNELPLPEFSRHFLLSIYVRMFNCNVQEALVEDLSQYRNLGEFFRRALKPGARPLAEDHLLVGVTLCYCIILCYIILYYIILYCVLYCITLYYIVLRCVIVLYYVILYCVTLYCIMLYYIVLYHVLYCITYYIVLRIILYYIIL